jgi:hypothetical protein
VNQLILQYVVWAAWFVGGLAFGYYLRLLQEKVNRVERRAENIENRIDEVKNGDEKKA